MIDRAALKQAVCAEVDRWADRLIAVSHHLHDHPELAYEEHEAHATLTAVLDDAGLAPTRRAHGLDTAFRAEAGTAGRPAVAVLCEYDALPGLGHACGHNIIAAAGLGAALAAAAVADQAGGRLVVLGTPAEEGGGGKIDLLRRGAFDGLSAALMVHPADADLTRMDTLAFHQLEMRYHGRAAHAAAAPWEGVNALDAAVLGYVAVGALRQHIRPDERVHGVFTHGGDKANIVPAEAATSWYVRAPTLEGLTELEARVLAALTSGATATGATVTPSWADKTLADLRDSPLIAAAYADNAAALGRTVAVPDPARRVLGSTDMGNVSHRLPSIHPMIAVAPPGTAIHTADFAVHARAESGDRGVVDGAKALAMTVVDLWVADGLLAAAEAAFEPGGAA